VSCAKTAEPIEMPFGMQSSVDPRNHAIDADAPREVAILRGYNTPRHA